MGKTDELKLWVRDEGPTGLVKAVWVTAIYLTPLYHVFESALGTYRHEQLIRGPRLGYWPEIQQPTTFNEKILHRKLCTDDDRYQTLADKWAVREYVDSRVGDEYLTDVYHVTDDPATIPFDDLPEEYVLKANHGCGWLEFVEDSSTVNRRQLVSTAQDWLSRTYGTEKREYWYRDIPPKVMVEEFIRGTDGDIPRDYKMYVFNGELKYTHIDFDRFGSPSRRFFDRAWNPMEFQKGGLPLGPSIEQPTQYEQMVEIAETLGEGFDFVRVDLYHPDDDRILFGEMTLAPASGISPFDPPKYDRKFGSYW